MGILLIALDHHHYHYANYDDDDDYDDRANYDANLDAYIDHIIGLTQFFPRSESFNDCFLSWRNLYEK